MPELCSWCSDPHDLTCVLRAESRIHELEAKVARYERDMAEMARIDAEQEERLRQCSRLVEAAQAAYDAHVAALAASSSRHYLDLTMPAHEALRAALAAVRA